MNNIEIIGKINDVFLLLHANHNGLDEFFVAVNYNTFMNWLPEQRNRLRIIQLVSNSIFFPDNHTIEIKDIKFSDETIKDTFYKTVLNNDPNFNKLVSNIEISDNYNNAVIFKNVKKILSYDQISDTSKIVVCEFKDDSKKIYLELNESQYFEINSEIFEIIQEGKIDKYFLK